MLRLCNRSKTGILHHIMFTEEHLLLLKFHLYQYKTLWPRVLQGSNVNTSGLTVYALVWKVGESCQKKKKRKHQIHNRVDQKCSLNFWGCKVGLTSKVNITNKLNTYWRYCLFFSHWKKMHRLSFADWKTPFKWSKSQPEGKCCQLGLKGRKTGSPGFGEASWPKAVRKNHQVNHGKLSVHFLSVRSSGSSWH